MMKQYSFTSILLITSSWFINRSKSECSYNYNLQFVVDESGSIGYEDYQSTIDFIESLVTNQINDYPTQISVYSFDTTATQVYSFGDVQDDTNRPTLQSALTSMKSQYAGGSTYTESALVYSLSDFEDSTSVSTTDRNFIYLVTDGAASDSPCIDSTTISTSISNTISTYDITIITIGIGNFDVTSIDCLSENYNTHLINGFTDADFATFTRECPDEAVTTPDDCCKNYDSCKGCINEECTERYCVWDTDTEVCQDAYTDGYPTNYATSISYCSDCCTDYSSCGDCTDDENYCYGYCVWDHDDDGCVNADVGDPYYDYPDNYSSDSYECDARTLTEYIIYIIIGAAICCLLICICCCYCFCCRSRAKKRQKTEDKAVDIIDNGTPATSAQREVQLAPVTTYVDQDGDPVTSVQSQVVQPTVIQYVDQNGNPVNMTVQPQMVQTQVVQQPVVQYVDQYGNPVAAPTTDAASEAASPPTYDQASTVN